ncbi:MAG: hypothetical protein H6636_09215 [Anaerolineales bacterium]|nr:hypothetical protein [Anaerolineales bacterium]
MDKRLWYFIRDIFVLITLFALIVWIWLFDEAQSEFINLIRDQNTGIILLGIYIAFFVFHIFWLVFWAEKKKYWVAPIPLLGISLAGFWFDEIFYYELLRSIILGSTIFGMVIIVLQPWYKDRLADLKIQGALK